VRGDSLRDLYAKGLALLGLGLLGGIGALVDYWPAGGEPAPAVAGALQMPRLASAFPYRDITIPVPAPEPRVTAPAVVVPVATEIPVESPAMMLADAMAQVSLAPPPLQSIAAPAPADVPAVEVALSVPELTALAPARAMLPDPVAVVAANEADDSGFFADAADVALKAGSTIANGTIKAGSTIAAGTMKAGAPLVEVVRVLGGAFKKLKFF